MRLFCTTSLIWGTRFWTRMARLSKSLLKTMTAKFMEIEVCVKDLSQVIFFLLSSGCSGQLVWYTGCNLSQGMNFVYTIIPSWNTAMSENTHYCRYFCLYLHAIFSNQLLIQAIETLSKRNRILKMNAVSTSHSAA